jgi:uncharacterized protein (DUF924 family)
MTDAASTHDTLEPAWVRQVLEFWFSELTEADWWAKNDVIDATIRSRFLELHEQLVASDGGDIDGSARVGEGREGRVVDGSARNSDGSDGDSQGDGRSDHGTHQPRTLLATVIVLDQFSRNMFRGNPRAYAADPLARRLARQAIAQGLDAGLRREERLFLYLPLEHSEDRADQARSVELFSTLGREDWTRYALAHKAVIDRFGRFPHRNAVLGRESTPEEIVALQDPMNSF